jgi:hypothetical protein
MAIGNFQIFPGENAGLQRREGKGEEGETTRMEEEGKGGKKWEGGEGKEEGRTSMNPSAPTVRTWLHPAFNSYFNSAVQSFSVEVSALWITFVTHSSAVIFICQGKVEDPFRAAVFYTSYALILIEFILLCFAEKRPKRKEVQGYGNKVECDFQVISMSILISLKTIYKQVSLMHIGQLFPSTLSKSRCNMNHPGKFAELILYPKDSFIVDHAIQPS